ncbi:hypothetical protein KUTeg_020588 [Tegillarca granosa]|uniref:C2 domain-containing protein n=1 Tax=Tegillarca granosa TaxID=220873 RepID=A0ABQ9ECP7_TEGGR|nr:hypothetical protein KUTeg_020588 [Tegillarca granosa]
MANVNFQAGTAAVPATQVEISVSCRSFFGRTEMIKDNLNPDFVKKFVMNYFFEESQKLKFEIYDVDAQTTRLDAHDFLGRIECTLGEIVGSPSGKFEKPLSGPVKNNGQIIIRAEEMSNCKELIKLQFRASHLDKKDFFGKSDPYLVFYRANEDNSHDFIGEFMTNLRELSRGAGPNNQYPNFNPSNPYCQGINGVLQAYHNSLRNVQLYGPTNFSPVINHVSRYASDNASNTMNVLDGDEQRLSYNGRYAERDIVQFVPFREFMNNRYGNNMQLSQAALAKEVLAEIPDQFLSYMNKHNFKPTKLANASAPTS